MTAAPHQPAPPTTTAEPLGVPLASMTEQEGRAVFLGIVEEVFTRQGRKVTAEICQGLLQCLHVGDYRLVRDDQGEISEFEAGEVRYLVPATKGVARG